MAEVRRWSEEATKSCITRTASVASVTVNSYNTGENTELSLRVNGKVDASTPGDMLPQLLFGIFRY